MILIVLENIITKTTVEEFIEKTDANFNLFAFVIYSKKVDQYIQLRFLFKLGVEGFVGLVSSPLFGGKVKIDEFSGLKYALYHALTYASDNQIIVFDDPAEYARFVSKQLIPVNETKNCPECGQGV